MMFFQNTSPYPTDKTDEITNNNHVLIEKCILSILSVLPPFAFQKIKNRASLIMVIMKSIYYKEVLNCGLMAR